MAAELAALLEECLSPDNAVRRRAEAAARGLARSPDIVPALLGVLRGNVDAQVRQLAAVLLRKWTGRHWVRLPAEVRLSCQQALLESLATEQLHSVRRALAAVTAAVGSLTLPSGEWPALLGFLQQCTTAPAAGPRETAMLLFGALFEAAGDDMQQHLPAVLAALAAAASDSSAAVRAAALDAVEPLLPYVSAPHVPAFHSLLVALLPAAHAALTAGDEDALTRLCQVLLEVAESPAPLLQPCLAQVLEMCMAVATTRRFAWDTREQALHLLQWVAQYKPKQLSRHKPLLRAVLDALCEMMAEPRCQDTGDADADDDDDAELPPDKAAGQTLDVLALALPSAAVFPPTWQFIQAAAAAPEPHRRAAAMTAAAVLAEGCAEPLRKRLPAAMTLLLAALSDVQPRVREAAAFALGQWSEFLQPDVLRHHGEVLPRVFSLLHDADHDVQERACYAMDAFCEHLELNEVLPYVPQLVQQLLALLQGGRPGVQEMALSALASVAAAAQEAFQPYAGQLLPVLDYFMRHPGSEHLMCRCRAIEAAGIMVDALGASDAVLRPHIPGMLEVCLAGYTTNDSPDIRDHSHTMFANIAKALGAEFEPWIPRVLPLAIASCRAEDGRAADQQGNAEQGSGQHMRGSPDKEQLDGSSDDDDDDDSDDDDFNVRTGLMDEKVSAIAALGAFAEACPAALLAHSAEVLSVLSDMCDYWHDEARAAAYDALGKLALAVHTAAPPMPGSGPLSPPVAALLDSVLPLLIVSVEDDRSRPAVAAAAVSLAKLLGTLPQGATAPSTLEGSANMARLLLQGRAACQETGDSDDGVDEDEDADEEEEELLAAATDLLPALATAMGPAAYAPVFASLHAEPLLSRLRPQSALPLRALAAGGIAEVANVLGHHASALAPVALPLLLRELQSDDAINRQNAAYATGLLVMAGPAQSAPLLTQLLHALHALFSPEEDPGARDNAAGAVGRMLAVLPQSAVPLDQVLPVLLSAVPLREDLGETTPIITALCCLLEGALSAVQQHVPQIVAAFGQVAVQEGVPVEAKHAAARALAALRERFPADLAPLLAALPPDHAAALAQYS